MASLNQCLASLARLSLSAPARPILASTIPKFLAPATATPIAHYATVIKRAQKKKKNYKTYKCWDLSEMEQFSLCDAMRYLRAFEVGNPPHVSKYELHVKLRTGKGGPVLRNRIRFPHPVKSDARIGVICPENSPLAAEALAAGAVAVGQETLFERIRQGDIPFNKLICHVNSEAALKKANLGRILGPKGMMPNHKTKTITRNIRETVEELIGADEYRERTGVVRIAVGQLGFTPQMLSDNIKAFMSLLKQDLANCDDNHPKSLDEVVLSSTHGPGFSLDGTFFSKDENLKPEHLTSAM